MGFRIVAGARRDFRGSITWYERQAGLGSEFISAVESAYRRIESEPETLPSAENPWPSRERDVRRCPVDGFPYQVIFKIRSGRDRRARSRSWQSSARLLESSQVMRRNFGQQGG